MNDLVGGVFEWVNVLPGCGGIQSGGIIVLGMKASPIGGREYVPGTESWFRAPDPLPGLDCHDPAAQFALRLVATGAPIDPLWVAMAAQVEAVSSYVGIAGEYPSWGPIADLGALGDAVVFTLRSVIVPNGQAVTPPLARLSLVANFEPMPCAPPTWFRTDAKVPPLFGTGTVCDGTTAIFAQVTPGAPGYPTSTWEESGPKPHASARVTGR